VTSFPLDLLYRYASPVHAERAASQHGTLLNADTLLSVLVLSPRLAQHLGIELNPDGSLRVEHCGDRVSQPMPTPAMSSSTPAGESGSMCVLSLLTAQSPQMLHETGSSNPLSSHQALVAANVTDLFISLSNLTQVSVADCVSEVPWASPAA
jgi:hypothetical protein